MNPKVGFKKRVVIRKVGRVIIAFKDKNNMNIGVSNETVK